MDLAVAITRKLVDNYMAIVEKNVADMVPKAIMRFLVNRSRKGLHQHLIATLYKCVPDWPPDAPTYPPSIFTCGCLLGRTNSPIS